MNSLISISFLLCLSACPLPEEEKDPVLSSKVKLSSMWVPPLSTFTRTSFLPFPVLNFSLSIARAYMSLSLCQFIKEEPPIPAFRQTTNTCPSSLHQYTHSKTRLLLESCPPSQPLLLPSLLTSQPLAPSPSASSACIFAIQPAH